MLGELERSRDSLVVCHGHNLVIDVPVNVLSNKVWCPALWHHSISSNACVRVVSLGEFPKMQGRARPGPKFRAKRVSR